MTISIIIFIAYILILVGIGLTTYLRTKSSSDYSLAGRSNNKWVTAISAESSDMSGWLLMGLPGAAYAAGLSSIWILIGLIGGTMLNWILVGNRIRIASETYQALSVTEFFEKRVHDKKGTVGVVAGIAVIFFMIINASAEIIGSGKLLNATFGLSYHTGIIIALCVVIAYTFLGGYMAVSWSNLFQGTLMFFTLLLVPLAVVVKLGGFGPALESLYIQSPSFFQFCNGETGWSAVSIIAGGLGVGFCYFGMIHVHTSFMSIRHSAEIKDSTLIATVWVGITSYCAVFIGMLGAYLFPAIADPEQVFFQMGADYFPPYLLGLFAAAVMAAVLSSVSAYVIVASAAVGTNLIKHFIKDIDDAKIVKAERISVVIICLISFLLSLKSDVVFSIALLASAGLGACFGPLVLFSLYTKNVNRIGAVASIITGLITVVVWYYSGLSNYIYEAIPGFIFSTIALVIGTAVSGGPDEDSVKEFETFKTALKNNKSTK